MVAIPIVPADSPGMVKGGRQRRSRLRRIPGRDPEPPEVSRLKAKKPHEVRKSLQNELKWTRLCLDAGVGW
jgi:hypothetical protein